MQVKNLLRFFTQNALELENQNREKKKLMSFDFACIHAFFLL